MPKCFLSVHIIKVIIYAIEDGQPVICEVIFMIKGSLKIINGVISNIKIQHCCC